MFITLKFLFRAPKATPKPLKRTFRSQHLLPNIHRFIASPSPPPKRKLFFSPLPDRAPSPLPLAPLAFRSPPPSPGGTKFWTRRKRVAKTVILTHCFGPASPGSFRSRARALAEGSAISRWLDIPTIPEVDRDSIEKPYPQLSRVPTEYIRHGLKNKGQK
jgi:hypothetical protein